MDRAPKILAFVLVALTCLAGIVWPWVDEVQDVARARAELARAQQSEANALQQTEVAKQILLRTVRLIEASGDTSLTNELKRMGIQLR